MMAALCANRDRCASPLLLIVTGPPASGKTYLARRLSQACQLPLIDKDSIKETLFDSLGWGTREWSRKLGGATYDLMFLLTRTHLLVGRSMILESNFRAQSEPTLRAIQCESGCRILQVHCDADPAVLMKRFRERWERGERHPGHVDDVAAKDVEAAVRDKAHPPLNLEGELVQVDTTDYAAIDFEAILMAVERKLKLTQSSDR